MNSLKKNLIYQTFYQILATAMPLITAPYVSRALGAEQLGIYTNIATTANYFTVVAGLGIATHGTRSIALNRENSKKESEIYSQIRFIQCCMALIIAVIYIAFVEITVRDNKLIYWIQLIWIINCAFDVNWFFNGIEEFKTTVTKNTVIKILTLISVFAFVHDKDDTWIYALALAGSTIVSNMVLWIKVRKYVTVTRIAAKDALQQLKPALLLFVPYVAMTLYHQMDKTMLGAYGLYTQLGYYANADKIINISIGVISGFGAVSLPRVSSLLAANQKTEYSNVVNKSIALIMFLCSALAFGIAAVSKEFTPIFFGEEFAECAPIVATLSMVMFFKSLATIARNQYLMPLGKDIEYMVSVFAGVAINFCLNSLLIKPYGAMGAVIATLITECIVCVVQLISMNRFVKVFPALIHAGVYLLMGVIMYLCVRLVAHVGFTSRYIGLGVEILIGGMLYVLMTLAYWHVSKDKLIAPTINASLKKILRK